MEINLVEKNENELNEIENFLEKNKINEQSFFEITKAINFSFSVEKCSRLLSHHICESLDSYTQQSQRYVKMGNNAFIIPDEIKGSKIEEEYKELVGELFEFYKKMTEMKEGFAGRKATEEDYVHGIKIEDGRYILPLATTTNIFVTMNFSKIINFFKTIKRLNNEEGQFLLEKIKEIINKKNTNKYIEKFSNQIQEEKICLITKKDFDKINEKKDVVLLNSFKNPILRSALGALTSTSEQPATEIKKTWDSGNGLEKARGVTERVVGYGHKSIIEHARTNFGSIMSLTCYHQFERHRLPSNIREQFDKIPIEREVIIPPSIQKNQEILKEFEKHVKKVKTFRKKLQKENLESTQNYLLLNCDKIKVISSTNARIDNDILAERTCNNAQWEIRNLYNKKLEILKKLGPVLYDKAGPPCTKGNCPEGALSCGKMLEMRQKFGYFGK